MGRKVHPTGFRLGVIQDWRAKWSAEKHYVDFLWEDLEIRRAIRQSGYLPRRRNVFYLLRDDPPDSDDSDPIS